MDFNGLSLDQAPPISAPLRFFLSAPLFAIIAGIMILFADPSALMSRYSLEAIVITHSITIGFFGLVMLGALTQMLPVLAGVKIPKVKLVTTLSHLFLVLGTAFMLEGLLDSSVLFNTLAFIFLGSGFFLLIGAIGFGMFQIQNFTSTVKAMSVSLVFGLFVVVMGLILLSAYITSAPSEYHLAIANIHSVWGIFGFAGILIIGVSFQVLPMFYVAPKFKPFCEIKLIRLIPLGAILWLFFSLFSEEYALFAKIMIGMFFIAYAIAAWMKIKNRRRSVSDITIWYWKSALLFLLAGIVLWIFDEYSQSEYSSLVAIFIGGGFIFSIMLGMLYKIIPFLVWFHLNGMGYMSIPTMNEMIDKKLTKVQFFLFLFSLLGFIFSFFIPQFLGIFALTFIVSMMIFEYNIIQPVLVYIKTKKTKPDFDMSSFGTN